jgi:hypothetical protein
MEISALKDQFRLQMGKILFPRSNGELKEATAWIESFRKSADVELVMIGIISSPQTEPLSEGEVILLAQTLQWRIARMSPGSLEGVDVSFLLQFASTHHINRVARSNIYLTIATLIIRIGVISSQPNVIRLFMETYNHVLSTQSVVQILSFIPEVAATALIYRGNKEASTGAMISMCTNLLNELPVVFSSFDILITDALEPLGVDESSLTVHPHREACFQEGPVFTSLLDTVQATLNWINMYTSTLDMCHGSSKGCFDTSSFCSPEYDSVWLQSKVVTLCLSVLRGMLTPSSAFCDYSESVFIIEDNKNKLYKLCAEVKFKFILNIS